MHRLRAVPLGSDRGDAGVLAVRVQREARGIVEAGDREPAQLTIDELREDDVAVGREGDLPWRTAEDRPRPPRARQREPRDGSGLGIETAEIVPSRECCEPDGSRLVD